MTAAPGRATHRPDIQGLRAIAVVSVVLYHFAFPFTDGGFIGVDIFFVISGFLVGGSLVNELHARGKIDLPGFFARRARRIVPAALVVIVAVLLVSFAVLSPARMLVWDAPFTHSSVVKDAIASVLYVPNLWFAAQGNDYLAHDSVSPYLHFWSLGIEEQFYIATPLLLLLIWALVRKRFAALVAVVAVLTAASFVYGVFLTSVNPVTAFYHPGARAWELGVGLLLAVVVQAGLVARNAVLARSVGATGLVVLLGCVVFLDTSYAWPGSTALVVVVATAMVIWAGAGSHELPRVWATRWITYLGDRSYSIYLWHWPVWVLVPAALNRDTGVLWWVIMLVGTLLLAEASYRWVEVRFRTAPVAQPRQRSRIFVGTTAAAVVVLAVAAVVPLAASARLSASGSTEIAAPLEPFEAQVSTDALVEPPATPVVFGDQLPANLRPTLAGLADDVPSSYRDDCHLNLDEREDELEGCIYGESGGLVALFGDSHAAQWLPALMPAVEAGEIRVLILTASSCGPVQSTGEDAEAVCDTWRANAFERMHEVVPDVVLMSSYMSGEGDQTARAESYAKQLEGTLAQLPAESRAIFIADTPIFDEAPADCVALSDQDISHCAIPMEDALLLDVAEAIKDLMHEHGQGFADFTPYLCSDGSCGIVVGDTFLYRDRHHLTTDYVAALAPVMRQALGEFDDLVPLESDD